MRTFSRPLPPARQSKAITLKQAISVQVEHGTVVIQPGTRLQFVSRDSSEVHVCYMNIEQAIPASAVDFR